MTVGYIESEYIEEDYFEDDTMAVTPLPDPPFRNEEKGVFTEKANLFLSRLPQFALEVDAVAVAMNNNSTNSTSTTSNVLASSGSKTFTVQLGKGYLPGQTIKAASTSDGTKWMQGDVTAYDPATGLLSITMNASQGSATFTAWTLTLATSVANATGSLNQDFSVKSLTHAIGASVASASTIDLSTVTGNVAHLTGNTGVGAATMTVGKDVWLIIDANPLFTYHATNLKLNSGGANVTLAAGDIALFTFDGTTVRVAIFKANGKAVVETAAPAGAPVGSGLIHFGSSAPVNYLACPTTPTNLSRSTYADLFTAIGTTWGFGDGTTTFGMPWLPANYTVTQSIGNVGTSYVGENLAHQHSYSDVDNTGTPAGGTYFTGSVGNNVIKTSGSHGGAANYPAGSRVLFCVRYQ